MPLFRRDPQKKAERDARKAEKKAVAEARASLRVERAERRAASDKARAAHKAERLRAKLATLETSTALREKRLEEKLATTEAKADLRLKRDAAAIGFARQKHSRVVRDAGWFWRGRPTEGGVPVAVRAHAEKHRTPSHHLGPCDVACRAGLRPHTHKAEVG